MQKSQAIEFALVLVYADLFLSLERHRPNTGERKTCPITRMSWMKVPN